MPKYGDSAQKKVEKAVHDYKRGRLKSGSSGQIVKSREQAVAIGLSQARKKGYRVPAEED